MKLVRIPFVLLILFTVLLSSCGSRKDIVYMQNIESAKGLGQKTASEAMLQPDDLLSIIISAETPEVTLPFNLPQIQGNYEVNNSQNDIKTYLIDSYGNIDFPVIGRMKLGGLTRTEATNKIAQAVSEYIKEPSVNLRILNFKVSVLGEVVKPGTFTIASERITLLEALGMAGDMTIFGKRNNVLVVRESDGKKTFSRLDITRADFLSSPYYYLAQNDVVFVEQNKTRINSSAVGPNSALIISAISLLITAAIILFR